MSLAAISKAAVVIALILGLGMVAIGSLFVSMGVNAKSEVANALRQEQIVTSADAPLPGVLVQDAKTAQAEQDAIEAHTFGKWGPYSKMAQSDPNRATYLNGLTLRTALNLAVVGFGVGDLAIGVGAVTIVLGLITAGFAIPVHLLILRFWRIAQAVQSTVSEGA